MKRGLIAGLVVVLGAVLAFFAIRSGRTGSNGSESAVSADTASMPSHKKLSPDSELQQSERKTQAKRAVPKPILDLTGEDDDEEERRTPEEKQLAADIEKSLDEENFELAKSCAERALHCKITEIRQAMVDTLGWFGEKALPELTPFIADADEDVAESAMNEWDVAVSGIKSDEIKIGMVELAMHVITSEDALESISSEYIGVDEKLAVESLLRVIESNGSEKGIASAKETYEFVTGEAFTDRAAAEKWIAEEYEPSEEDR